jgi:putative glutamine amidotransferase
MTSPFRRPHLTIAVTFDFNKSHGYFLKSDVVEALVSRGVRIVPLIYTEQELGKILSEVDGVVLPGGLGDIDPKAYGQKKKYSNVEIIQERFDFESRLLELYLPTRKPLLAICWGLQALNVFFGGSLIQDLDRDRKSKIRHQQTKPKHLPTHWVFFESKSRTQKLLKTDRLFVNSTHHQAIDQLGSSLVAEGRSSDGIIEACALRDHPFCLAVQWHPERLKNDPVIPAFLKACRRLRS